MKSYTYDLKLDDATEKKLKKQTKEYSEKIKTELKRKKIKAEVFLGGSLGKGTLEKSDFYDVDIFVRFEDGKEISDRLKNVLKKIEKNLEEVHGSRDYFRIREKNVDYEFIPVKKIKTPKDAENITDLSYFHVNFVRKNLNEKLIKEIMTAKRFFKAQKIYGAESYVNGFSGYALECLIIYYRSFEKMLKDLVKVEKKKLVIDIKKHYKKKEDVIIEMNEARIKSPIILVDPTWKERNVLASLNAETFRKFQNAAKEFLKKPSEEFFIIKKADFLEFSKKNTGECVKISIETNRQEGDIAGTKMRKFSRWLIEEIGKRFEILDSEFNYESGQNSELFISAKSKGEILRTGPKADDKTHANAFKKANKHVFEKDKVLYYKEKVDYSLKNFLEKLKEESKVMSEMGITSLRLSKN